MNRLICILLGALGLLMLSASGLLHKRLLFMRQEERLNLAAPLENAPPLVAFTTVALGGFRGVLADFLWLRASALEEEGRYFELVQLADWITKLEPRCSTIWAFQAWNMAYNNSALFTDPDHRWRWIRRTCITNCPGPAKWNICLAAPTRISRCLRRKPSLKWQIGIA